MSEVLRVISNLLSTRQVRDRVSQKEKEERREKNGLSQKVRGKPFFRFLHIPFEMRNQFCAVDGNSHSQYL